MSDMSDCDVNEKVRLHKKRDTRNRTKEQMIKYYSDPEKQEKLKQRIADYEETARRYQLKANQLKEFVQPPEPLVQRHSQSI
jgi:hypothetical protein